MFTRINMYEPDSSERASEVDMQNRDVVAVAVVSTHLSDWGQPCQQAAAHLILMFIHFPAKALYIGSDRESCNTGTVAF